VVDARAANRAPSFLERAFHRRFSPSWRNDHRPPGSGVFALDGMRRTPMHSLFPVARDSLNGVLCAAQPVLDVVFTREEVTLLQLATSSAQLDLVAALYYHRGDDWWRVDEAAEKLDEACLDGNFLCALEARGVLRTTAHSKLTRGDYAAAFDELRVDELKSLLNLSKSGVAKQELVSVALGRAAGSLDAALNEATGGGLMQLAPGLAECILRLHQLVLTAAGHAPEDFAPLLLSGVLAGRVRPFLAQRPIALCDKGCWSLLLDVLGRVDAMSMAVPRGDRDGAFACMHEASSRLLDTSGAVLCPCWAMRQAVDYDARVLLAGVCLLEKERKYEQAVHYLRLALQENVRLASVHTKGKLLTRFATDLMHLGDPTSALEELEKHVLGSGGFLYPPSAAAGLVAATRNRLGGVGGELVGLMVRLSQPPRRWKLRGGLEPLRDLMTVTIEVERVPDASVESMALAWYQSVQKWPHGMHCENGLLLTIFGLLFCVDPQAAASGPSAGCAFSDRPFLSGLPAEQRIEDILQGRAAQLLHAAWTAHHGKLIHGVNFERNPLPELLDIVRCIPDRVLAMACGLYVDHYDAWLGGLGDLFLCVGGRQRRPTARN
jgi:hypothetical protein